VAARGVPDDYQLFHCKRADRTSFGLARLERTGGRYITIHTHLPLRGTCRITLHTEPVRVLRFFKDAVWSSGDHQLVQIVLTNLRSMLMGAGEFR
jgi:hypothetical protein